MIAKRRLKKYLTKGIRKVRHRKGHGVHSPFAFALITQVINERSPYYAYQDILKAWRKQSRKRRILPNFVNKRANSTKVLFLLYRLVNRFKARAILEVGSTDGLTTLAMQLADSSCRVTNVDYASLGKCKEHGPYDFILVHRDLLSDAKKADFCAHLVGLMHEQTVIVVKGIHRYTQMHALWTQLRANEQVRVSMDLYEVGLAVAQPKLFKQHYVVSF